MSSSASLKSVPLARGDHAPATPSDLRSPCPVVNSLANHGYIPRDGRNVRANELHAAMHEVGLSTALGAVFARPIFLEHYDASVKLAKRSFLGYLWYLVRNPWALLFSAFAMRKPGQKDSAGKPCLNLDQLALHGAVEHDVSLTRRDLSEGDNLSRQPDLVRDLLASSSDGGRTISGHDLAQFRLRRIAQQMAGPHQPEYGAKQHQAACAEIALILNVFGDGKKIPCEYVRAVFQEERLPLKEGWSKRRWWPVGILEVVRSTKWIQKMARLDTK